jgi:hypothetical protein
VAHSGLVHSTSDSTSALWSRVSARYFGTSEAWTSPDNKRRLKRENIPNHLAKTQSARFSQTNPTMPPKNTSNKSRAAFLAGVAFGLSKAEPSDVVRNPADDPQVGMEVDESNVPLLLAMQTSTSNFDPQSEAPRGPRVPSIATILIPDRHYCNFCGHKASVLRTCGGCRAAVCEQPGETSRGCVPFKEGLVADFLCPHCARLKLRKEVSFGLQTGTRKI